MREKVLSIGCGEKREGTVNVDINPAVGPDVVCDGLFLPFRNETFDKCILRHVLEHTLQPDELLAECNRVLKTEGLIYVTFPNFASFTVLLEWFGKKTAYSEDLILGSRTERMQWKWQWHKQLHTTITVKELLNRHGFHVQKVLGHSPNVGPKTLQFLGSILVKLFSGRAGNVTMIAKKMEALNN